MKATKKSKRQKTDSDLEEEEQLRASLKIVPDEEEEINYEVLGMRYPIVNWESAFYHTDRYGVPHDYYRVFRANGSSRYIKELFSENVHILALEDGTEIHMLAERRYPLIRETLERMMELRLTAESKDIKNWLVQKQTDFGKDFSNPFTADSLLKTIWFSTHHASHAPCYSNEALAIPEQMATGKEISNPFMADKMADENVPAPAPTRNTLTYEAKVGAYSFELDETRFVLDAVGIKRLLKVTTAQLVLTAGTKVNAAGLQLLEELLLSEVESENIDVITVVTPSNVKKVESNHESADVKNNGDAVEPKTVRKNSFRPPVIEDWNSNDDSEVEFIPNVKDKTVRPSTEKIKFVKSARETVEKGNPRQKEYKEKRVIVIASSPTKKGRKDKAHVIPYCRFTKLIICHLRRTNNIHQRSASPFHLAEEDLRLGNLKFVPKGEEDEVFGMSIPNELISNNIRNALYYNAYLEMKSSKQAPASKPKPAKEKPSKPPTAKPPKPKPAKEKSTKATPLQKAEKGKVAKVRNVKSSFYLVNEPDEEPAQPEPEPKPEHQGEAIEEASTRPSTQPQDNTSANIVRDSPSPTDAETGAESDKTNSGGDTEILHITEEIGEDVDKQVNLEEKTIELDQDQAGSDPGETHKS
ncbi:hypothetical protein Tco_0807809 [Tanacetum coccineum]